MHTNALIHQKSPYLRQHAHNPVNWLPWGEAAFKKARDEDKPIFLSVGYSTCHWCHVMAHESFENEAVADLLNRDFVPIKLDREERPDVDRVYMLFVQATTGSGGWPMSVWLTPELKPFFGGTYFPPDSRYGRPGFRDLLEHLARAWKNERGSVEASGQNVAEQLRAMTLSARTTAQTGQDLFEAGFWQFRRMFDSRWGGFGGAPKFPRPVVLNYLLRYSAMQQNQEALEMVSRTLRGMAAGGMHDQLGGGFHRYSVDERWFVPHFEKMLYDQAQLAISFLETYQATGDAYFADVARDIFAYVLRDLTDANGAFYSAEDADSPDPEEPSHSREGAFYVWRKQEIDSLLGREDAAVFCACFGIEANGNVDQDPHGEFMGRNILYESVTEEEAGRRAAPVKEALERAKQIVFYARSRRPRPHLDRKILTSWNALMISAFAKAFMILRDRLYLEAAEKAVSFLRSNLYNSESGQLLRRFCDGEAAIPGFLDDYAFLAQAMIDLFEASFDPYYLEAAIDLADRGLGQFEDAENGGFFSTVEHAPDVLLRMKDDYDGAEPSGNSVATDVLLRLSNLTGSDSFRSRADKSLASFAPKLRAQPTIAPQMAAALGRSLGEPEQVVIRCAEIDREVETRLAAYSAGFVPNKIMVAITDAAAERLRATAPFVAGLERQGRMTVYECRAFVCELPKVIS